MQAARVVFQLRKRTGDRNGEEGKEKRERERERAERWRGMHSEKAGKESRDGNRGEESRSRTMTA